MMSCAARTDTPRIGRGPHSALVLADAGSDMWLVRANFDNPPRVGTAFSFNGQEWKIAWQSERGFGAQPANHRSPR